MSTVYSNIGVLEKQNERQFVRTHKLDEGYVLYGTYQHLGTGRYSVKFDIRPDDDADAGVVCCKIDVVTNQGRVKLLERMLSVRELRENDSELDVEFKMLEPGPAEYRVFATGTTGLRVACDLRASVISDFHRTYYLCTYPGKICIAKGEVASSVELRYLWVS